MENIPLSVPGGKKKQMLWDCQLSRRGIVVVSKLINSGVHVILGMNNLRDLDGALFLKLWAKYSAQGHVNGVGCTIL